MIILADNDCVLHGNEPKGWGTGRLSELHFQTCWTSNDNSFCQHKDRHTGSPRPQLQSSLDLHEFLITLLPPCLCVMLSLAYGAHCLPSTPAALSSRCCVVGIFSMAILQLVLSVLDAAYLVSVCSRLDKMRAAQ